MNDGCVLRQRRGATARFAGVNLAREMCSDCDAVTLRNAIRLVLSVIPVFCV